MAVGTFTQLASRSLRINVSNSYSGGSPTITYVASLSTIIFESVLTHSAVARTPSFSGTVIDFLNPYTDLFSSSSLLSSCSCLRIQRSDTNPTTVSSSPFNHCLLKADTLKMTACAGGTRNALILTLVAFFRKFEENSETTSQFRRYSQSTLCSCLDVPLPFSSYLRIIL